jgi:hypothetical protein
MSTDVARLQIVSPEDHWLNRLATWLLIRWLKWRVAHMPPIDANMQCPACGHRSGEIKFVAEVQFADNKDGGIIHRCKICDANWAEKPIIRAADWVIELPVSRLRDDPMRKG